jgi:hypothetical protein
MSDEDQESAVSTPTSSSLVYFQSPRHLGPGLDSFTPGGFPATPMLHVARSAQHGVVSSPLSLNAFADSSDGSMDFPTIAEIVPRSSRGGDIGGSQMVLVLGCGGLVGTHAVAKLLASGYNVRIFMLETASGDQFEALQSQNRGPGKLFVFRGEQLDRAIEDCHYVVIAQLPRCPRKYSRAMLHAASSQEALKQDCVTELQDLFLCAKRFGKRLKRIVFVSSAAAVFPVVEPVQLDTLYPKTRQVLLKEVERLALRASVQLVSLLP